MPENGAGTERFWVKIQVRFWYIFRDTGGGYFQKRPEIFSKIKYFFHPKFKGIVSHREVQNRLRYNFTDKE